MTHEIEHIVERLDRARAGLKAAATAVPVELWRKAPRTGAWSAAEVIAHLMMVERGVSGRAARLLAGPPPVVSYWKRFHLPLRLTEWRGVKVKSPVPLDPALVAERQEMLARLDAERRRTLALLDESRDRSLKAYRAPHPLLGSLNLCDWFKVLAHHEVRHTKQIREIVDSFQR